MPTLPVQPTNDQTAPSPTSACELVFQVVDVLSGAPLRAGGYVKSCRIISDHHTQHLRCPDRQRHPRASFARGLYAGHQGAEERQRARFYRYVSASLEHLGAWQDGICDRWSEALGEAIVGWQRPLLDADEQATVAAIAAKSLVRAVHFLAAEKRLTERLEQALSGWDHVDREGCLRFHVPVGEQARPVKVRLEFHDLKYLTQDDVSSAFGALRTAPSRGVAPHFRVVYKDSWASFDERDPDHPKRESAMPLSNWCIQADHDASVFRQFRNFATFDLVAEPSPTQPSYRRIHALCYCQPSWYDTMAFHRAAPTSAEACSTDQPACSTTLPALTTTHDGGGTFNHGAYGGFCDRPGSHELRLHAGLNIAGAEDRTPVFAVKGGRVLEVSARLVGVHHDEEQFTHYLHMNRRFPSRGQWVKAGTLLGMVGRRGIPEDDPTHLHFATLADERAEPAAGDRDGNAGESVPSHGDGGWVAAIPIRAPTRAPANDRERMLRREHGEFVREPNATLRSWAAAQLSDSASALYATVFPDNAQGWHVPPCMEEYRSLLNKPVHCTASCLGEHDSLVVDQVRFAKDCFAVRTNKDPRFCACPGLSGRGIEGCFTLRQRIQHQLWVAGEYAGAFDGRLEGSSRHALLAMAPRLPKLNALLDEARRAKRKAKPRTWASGPADDAALLTALLRDAENVRRVLAELENLTRGGHGGAVRIAL